ncbi:MAG: 5-formyltetrahydrofolate cyclo-ligase [Verrucomicrobiae bacterium]|nr:5-formyltetrahydrofolate cyclo-ligase [Verrucomicrobiae bacterium]
MSITEEKSRTRNRMRSVIAAFSPAERACAGAELVKIALGLPAWRSAKSLMLFSPLPDEPPIGELLNRSIAGGKITCLPRYDPQSRTYGAAIVTDPDKDLRKARYGILEPADSCANLPLNQLDLVFVPGVAFAPGGARLGRGRGFYDRLLTMVNGEKIGIGFSQQLLSKIPTEPHDARVSAILTPHDSWNLRTAERS